MILNLLCFSNSHGRVATVQIVATTQDRSATAVAMLIRLAEMREDLSATEVAMDTLLATIPPALSKMTVAMTIWHAIPLI